MTTSRRKKIEAMLADDPQDQMLRYMLALELDKEGENDRSLEILAELMQGEAPHVPAFLMAGQQLGKLGRVDDAKATFTKGIAEAKRQGNEHAAGEMTQFKMELG